MEFNKDGKIDRYTNLDDILRLDLSDEVRGEISSKFGRNVFFDSDGSCKVGKLIGLEKNHQLSMMYYIILDRDGKKYFVPTYKSITIL